MCRDIAKDPFFAPYRKQALHHGCVSGLALPLFADKSCLGALTIYAEQAESLFQSYLDHAEAFINKKKVLDTNTKQELEPDTAFLSSIEEQIGIAVKLEGGVEQAPLEQHPFRERALVGAVDRLLHHHHRGQ